MAIENINNGTIATYAATLRTLQESGIIIKKDDVKDDRENNYKVNSISRDYALESRESSNKNNYLSSRSYNSSGKSSSEKILNRYVDIFA